MHTALTDEQYQDLVGGYERTAFRFESQPAYVVGYERELFDGFLAGRPEPPTSQARFRAWYDHIARRSERGITTQRVRLVDEPPTDYQRWTRYMDRWNIEAGETIQYLRRSRAHDVGLTDTFGGGDWWLLDDSHIIVMTYEQGRRIHSALVTQDSELRRARVWRDLAIRAAREDVV